MQIDIFNAKIPKKKSSSSECGRRTVLSTDAFQTYITILTAQPPSHSLNLAR